MSDAHDAITENRAATMAGGVRRLFATDDRTLTIMTPAGARIVRIKEVTRTHDGSPQMPEKRIVSVKDLGRKIRSTLLIGGMILGVDAAIFFGGWSAWGLNPTIAYCVVPFAISALLLSKLPELWVD